MSDGFARHPVIPVVVHPGQVNEVAAAVARFAVSPGFDDELVERMHSKAEQVDPVSR